jgi:Regulator of ribonuclease activity B
MPGLPANPVRIQLKRRKSTADELPMGIFSRSRQEPVDLETRAPQTGVKYKDLLVLNQLRQAGADLTAPRQVLYYLYFNDSATADTVARTAAASEFAAKVREPIPEDPDKWGVVCERKSYVLSMDIVRDNTDYFEKLAAQFGGVYDGWEASVN